MLAGTMLLLAAAGQVVQADATSAVVRAEAPVQVGDTLEVRRLEPAAGAPGRAPFYRWTKAAKVRVTALRPDGMAEVALVRGSLAAGDRVVAD